MINLKYEDVFKAYLNNDHDSMRFLLPEIFHGLKTIGTPFNIYHGVTPKNGNELDEIGTPLEFPQVDEYINLIEKIYFNGIKGHSGNHPILHDDKIKPIFCAVNVNFSHGIVGLGIKARENMYPVFSAEGTSQEECVLFSNSINSDFIYVKSPEFIEINGHDGTRSNYEKLKTLEKKALNSYSRKCIEELEKRNLEFLIVDSNGEFVDFEDYYD